MEKSCSVLELPNFLYFKLLYFTLKLDSSLYNLGKNDLGLTAISCTNLTNFHFDII